MTAQLSAHRPQHPDVVAPELIDLPGGSFTMGRADRRPDERPPHVVTLPPFRVAVAPVTNHQYDAFVQAIQAAPPPFRQEPRFRDPDQPVVGVDWFDAVAYCDWLAGLSGLPVRLPSEAEREYAALGPQAGSSGPSPDWPWGETDPADHRPLAFVARATGPHVPRPACANGYGLRCMAENVHEWCTDAYRRRYDLPPTPGADLRGADARITPPSPDAVDPTQRRSSRGGSWRHHIKFTRVSARSSLRPGFRYNDYGLRLYASMCTPPCDRATRARLRPRVPPACHHAPVNDIRA